MHHSVDGILSINGTPYVFREEVYKRQVMGHADGCEPAFFQNPNPPLLCILIFAGTKDTVVMVDAAAPEKYRLVINSQSGFCLLYTSRCV